MAHLFVPQNHAQGVCRRFVPDIQVCSTHGRENLNATIIPNTEKEGSPSHDHPPRTFKLLHATLHQNGYTTLRFPRKPVTLSEHQSHSNWNQSVEFSSVLHHTKLETNRFTSVLTHDDVKSIFHKIMSAELSPLNITCAE